LALLEVRGLKATPLAISVNPVPAGTEVSILDLGLDSTPQPRALTAKVAAQAPPHVAPFDADALFALSDVARDYRHGGVVLTRDGALAGIVLPSTAAARQAPVAVSGKAIRDFVLFTLGAKARLAPQVAAPARDGWTDAVAAARLSVVELAAYTATANVPWADSGVCEQLRGSELNVPAAWDGLTDPWCMACNGTSQVDCPNRDCKNGVIVGRKPEVIRLPTSTKIQQVVTRTTCSTCSGEGWIECPRCSNGLEPDF
jgi:hypothetical protein